MISQKKNLREIFKIIQKLLKLENLTEGKWHFDRECIFWNLNYFIIEQILRGRTFLFILLRSYWAPMCSCFFLIRLCRSPYNIKLQMLYEQLLFIGLHINAFLTFCTWTHGSCLVRIWCLTIYLMWMFSVCLWLDFQIETRTWGRAALLDRDHPHGRRNGGVCIELGIFI